MNRGSNWFGIIIDRAVEVAMKEFNYYRRGFYRATISISSRTYHRAQVVPDWMPDGAADWFLRVSPAILDVHEAVGERVAVVSEDGIPERGAILGKLWDAKDAAERMTVWLRAHLQKHPGHLEIGCAQSLRIRVGENLVTVTPLADGVLRIEADVELVLDAPSIRAGENAVDAVALAPAVESEFSGVEMSLDPLNEWMAACIAAGAYSPPPVTPPVPYTAGTVGASKVKGE